MSTRSSIRLLKCTTLKLLLKFLYSCFTFEIAITVVIIDIVVVGTRPSIDVLDSIFSAVVTWF